MTDDAELAAIRKFGSLFDGRDPALPIQCRHPGCTAKYDFHHVHSASEPGDEHGG